MRALILSLVWCISSSAAIAEIKTEIIEYKDSEVTLEGFIAWDSAKSGRMPGVMVVHQWMGLTDYEKGRCRQLAELGYVAFAVDIYGQGIRPTSMQDAAKQSGIYKTDRQLYRHRLNLGLTQLKTHPNVAADRVGAIGYCFGGTGVLELARSGAAVSGVVSFHGGLDSPTPADGRNIRSSILVCHGADDPFVPQKDIEAFTKELNEAKVDWQMINYSGAVHSFTQPMAGNDNSRGAAYNAKADKRSWEAMKAIFGEVLAR
ncbi:MAG: dienelactone hydrolase family protein [Planctomycetota bacterium]